MSHQKSFLVLGSSLFLTWAADRVGNRNISKSPNGSVRSSSGPDQWYVPPCSRRYVATHRIKQRLGFSNILATRLRHCYELGFYHSGSFMEHWRANTDTRVAADSD